MLNLADFEKVSLKMLNLTDFEKVSLKMLNLADFNSFSDLFSVHLRAMVHLNLKLF